MPGIDDACSSQPGRQASRKAGVSMRHTDLILPDHPDDGRYLLPQPHCGERLVRRQLRHGDHGDTGVRGALVRQQRTRRAQHVNVQQGAVVMRQEIQQQAAGATDVGVADDVEHVQSSTLPGARLAAPGARCSSLQEDAVTVNKNQNRNTSLKLYQLLSVSPMNR